MEVANSITLFLTFISSQGLPNKNAKNTTQTIPDYFSTAPLSRL